MTQENKILKARLMDVYQALENKYTPMGLTIGTYDTPVNFNESLRTPIHRWYGYKEGFSPSFVNEFVSKYSRSSEDIIFDPFGGVGTTGLEANKMGYNAYLMDVNPLGIFASTVKTRHYSDIEVEHFVNEINLFESIEKWPITLSIDNKTIVKYFDETTWNSLLQIKSYISKRGDETVRNLFSLALLSLIEEISTHHKNGNGVKKKRMLPEPLSFSALKEKLVGRLSMYIGDIKNTNLKGETTIFYQSNLEGYALPSKADIVLTSPPYANCFDYSKVYLTELWVGGFFTTKEDQKLFRDKSVISHVHYRWNPRNETYGTDIINNLIVPILEKKDLWSNNIIPMLKGYFSDMGKFLFNLSKNLNEGATVGIVVGNSVYGGTPIATDVILARQAEELGYKCINIKVYRKVIASSQQMILLSDYEKKYVRESLVVLKWIGETK